MSADHLLAQCIRSGQASAEQIHQHFQAGELPITLEDCHGIVCGDTQARLLHLADIGATVLIEAYARRELRTFGDARNIYNYASPDEEELPDEKTRTEMESDLAQAAAHLFERELIFRPWDDKPTMVAFKARA